MAKINRPGIILLLSLRSMGLAALLLVYGAYSQSQADGAKLIGPIHAVAFCPDGERIATANQDGTVRVWDLHDGRETARLGKRREGSSIVPSDVIDAFLVRSIGTLGRLR